MKSRKVLLLAFLGSFSFHSLLLFFLNGDFNSQSVKKIPVRSPLKVDRIVIQSKKPTTESGDHVEQPEMKSKSSERTRVSKNNKRSRKGKKDALKHDYLENVRNAVLERQKYPFAAKKLELEASYTLFIKIFSNGSFAYKMTSVAGHPAFERSIQKMFKELSKFDPPPIEAGESMPLTLTLEFAL